MRFRFLWPMIFMNAAELGGGGGGAPPAAPQPGTPTPPATPPPATPPTPPTPPVTPPAPAPAPAPASPAAPPQPPPTQLPNVSAEDLARLYAQIQNTIETEVSTARRQYVREMGLKVPLQDDELDAIIPKADPRTDAGKTQLVNWRNAKSHLFLGPVAPPAAKLEDIARDAVGGEQNIGRRLFGAATFVNMVADHTRKEI